MQWPPVRGGDMLRDEARLITDWIKIEEAKLWDYLVVDRPGIGYRQHALAVPSRLPRPR